MESPETFNLMNWIVPIIVAVITGGFSYLGVKKSVKSSHDQMLLDLKSEQQKLTINTEHQINGIKEDIKRLEVKQDKHNAVIERTYKLEQKVEDIEKRMK